MEKDKKKSDEDTIFIGQKPSIVYVEAIETRLVEKNKNEAKVVACGKNIYIAVDAVEKAIKKYLVGDNAVQKTITTGIKIFPDGGCVPSIEIVLKKIKI